MAFIRLELEKKEAPAGGRLAGMVSLTLNENLPVRGVRLRLYGYEQLLKKEPPPRMARWLEPPKPGRNSKQIICTETTLTGREPFKSKIEEIADTWSFLLGRRPHPTLQAGEYSYPFIIHMPGNLLPTYFGQNCEVRYFISAYADVPRFFKKKVPVISEEIIVLGAVLEGGELRAQSAVEDSVLSVSIQNDAVQPDTTLNLRYEIQNPSSRKIRGLEAVLIQKETSRRKIFQRTLSSVLVDFSNTEQSFHEGELQVPVPKDSACSFEGFYSSISHVLTVMPRAEWWQKPVELIINIGLMR